MKRLIGKTLVKSIRKPRKILERTKDQVEDASQFMQRGEWAKAARQFRISPSPTGSANAAPMQHGHALKEAGFLSLAGAKYDASNTKGEDAYDYHLQMGHLYKVRGLFQDAIDSYEQAIEIARQAGNIDELAKIKGYLSPVVHLVDQMAAPADIPDYYVSSAATNLVKAISSPDGAQLGKANYSYAFAAHGFIRALEDLGYYVIQESNPEFHPAPRTAGTKKAVHICFAPPPLARVMKGTYNIIHFAWEFPRIPSVAENVSPHPFEDWTSMLAAFDEVWVPSQYAASVISRITSKPVRWVPTPIALPRRPVRRGGSSSVAMLGRTLENLKWVPLSIFPRLQQNFANHAMARARSTPQILRSANNGAVPMIFLTILNPHDRRKQLKPLIEAFCRFVKENESAILLIKTSSPDDTNGSINQRILSHQIAEDTSLVHPYVSERVWILNGALTADQMDALYGLSSFYVCTSYAEGQNLPLLESMASGCVPVSVDHTAMADYITAANSVLIQSHLDEPPPVMRRAYNMFDDFQVHTVEAESVLSALREAATLSADQYLEKSRESINTVKMGFGIDALHSRIKDSTH